jgi:hypothetical protein
MEAHISPLMRKIMNDPEAGKQLSAALDPFYDGKDEARPTITFEGKTYSIKTMQSIGLVGRK